jgi:hypothetical protein
MEERLVQPKSRGLNTTGLRTWGMVILVLATVGKALLQNRLLQTTGTNLLDVLNTENGMLIATIALILQAVEGLAVPIFCFLLVEGAVHTSDLNRYLARVVGLACATELPYNFAMSGKLLDLSSRNPVFAMALGLVLIWFYRRYDQKSLPHVAVKAVVTFAAVVWAGMLSVAHGGACVILVAVLWVFRNKHNFRLMAGGAATMLCCLLSPFYMAAPMGFLVVYFYNGEKGASTRLYNYLVYPVSLVLIGFIGMFLV